MSTWWSGWTTSDREVAGRVAGGRDGDDAAVGGERRLEGEGAERPGRRAAIGAGAKPGGSGWRVARRGKPRGGPAGERDLRAPAKTRRVGTCGRPSMWSPWMWVRTTRATSAGRTPRRASWWSSSSSRVTWNVANVASRAAWFGRRRRGSGRRDARSARRGSAAVRPSAPCAGAGPPAQPGADAAVHGELDLDGAGGEGVDGERGGGRGGCMAEPIARGAGSVRVNVRCLTPPRRHVKGQRAAGGVLSRRWQGRGAGALALLGVLSCLALPLPAPEVVARPAACWAVAELLLDDAALVVGDLQALLEEGDRLGGAAGEAQRPAVVVEREGVVQGLGVALRRGTSRPRTAAAAARPAGRRAASRSRRC